MSFKTQSKKASCKTPLVTISIAVPALDLQIKGKGEGGGGWVGHSDPEIMRGGPQKNKSSALRASVRSNNKGRREGRLAPWAPPLDPPLVLYFPKGIKLRIHPPEPSFLFLLIKEEKRRVCLNHEKSKKSPKPERLGLVILVFSRQIGYSSIY